MAAVLSFGQDPRWRSAMVGAVGAEPHQRVLDVATGTGLVAAKIVRLYGCTVVGLDQSPQMLEAARARLTREPLLASRVSLVVGEAERLPFRDCEFDHVTFTYLLRYVDDPAATLRELSRVLKPGGTIAALDFAVPSAEPWRSLWRFYVNVALPVLGRLVSRGWGQAGLFLARNIPAFYERHPIDEITGFWRCAGIESPQVRRMSLGGGLVMWGTKSGRDSPSEGPPKP